MSISLQAPPEGSAIVVGELIRALPGRDSETERRSSFEDARAARPIPIYGMLVETLASGGLDMFDEAQRTGWRFLVYHQDEGLIVDVPEAEAGPRLLRGGGDSDRLARASVVAERIADEADDYDARILDFHPMAPPTLWLRSRRGRDRDLFVSLGAAARRLSGPRLRRKLRRRALAETTRHYDSGGEAGG